MNYKNIIFDLDNTICDLILDWNIFEDELEKIYKKYNPDYVKNNNILYEQNEYIKKYTTVRKEIIDLTYKFETQCLQTYKPITKTINFIKNSNKNLYLWSNNHSATTNKVLNELQIINKFTEIISKDDVNLIKPEIDGFKRIYKSEHSLGDYLFVGNDPKTDELAAKNAKIAYLHFASLP